MLREMHKPIHWMINLYLYMKIPHVILIYLMKLDIH